MQNNEADLLKEHKEGIDFMKSIPGGMDMLQKTMLYAFRPNFKIELMRVILNRTLDTYSKLAEISELVESEILSEKEFTETTVDFVKGVTPEAEQLSADNCHPKSTQCYQVKVILDNMELNEEEKVKAIEEWY